VNRGASAPRVRRSCSSITAGMKNLKKMAEPNANLYHPAAIPGNHDGAKSL
jgi:hypothetical protein